MIAIGFTAEQRSAIIRDRIDEVKAKKVFVISPARFPIPGWSEEMKDPTTEADGAHRLFIDWPSVILYRYYYRLLQEIDGDTLLVINEGLRTQNRHDLSYNCIRAYANRTPHVLVLNTWPIIDQADDVMVLIDWVTRSRWKRDPFSPDMLSEIIVLGRTPIPTFEAIPVHVDQKTHDAYATEKAKLLAQIRSDGDKDPHILPRTLHLMSGKAKLAHVREGANYLGRNNRFKIQGLETWRAVADRGDRVAFELPHNMIDVADALAVTGARHVPVLVADTKADRWYFERVQGWAGRVRDAASALHR